MSLASKLPWTHRFAGGYPGIGSQPLPIDADAIDYLSRMATADGAGVETGVATAVDAFFRDTKAAGVFDALKACCILAGARTLAGALVPVVGDAPANVADGFVEGDFSRTAGLTGDGSTTYLDSGRADDEDPQNDRHLAVYVTGGTTVNRHFIGNFSTTPVFSMSAVYWGLTSNIRSIMSGNSTLETTGTYGGSTATFAGAVRTGATAAELRALGETDTDNSASTGRNTINNYVFARNDAGTANVYSDATLAFYSIGTSLSLEDLDTAVTNLINRLKFALLVGENPSGLDPDTIDYIVRGYEAGGSLE